RGAAPAAPVTARYGWREVGTAGSLSSTTRRSSARGALAGPATSTPVAHPDLTRNPTAAGAALIPGRWTSLRSRSRPSLPRYGPRPATLAPRLAQRLARRPAPTS